MRSLLRFSCCLSVSLLLVIFFFTTSQAQLSGWVQETTLIQPLPNAPAYPVHERWSVFGTPVVVPMRFAGGVVVHKHKKYSNYKHITKSHKKGVPKAYRNSPIQTVPGGTRP
jgi:hypothetical protein